MFFIISLTFSSTGFIWYCSCSQCQTASCGKLIYGYRQ